MSIASTQGFRQHHNLPDTGGLSQVPTGWLVRRCERTFSSRSTMPTTPTVSVAGRGLHWAPMVVDA